MSSPAAFIVRTFIGPMNFEKSDRASALIFAGSLPIMPPPWYYIFKKPKILSFAG
jgi:hypothetical protein